MEMVYDIISHPKRKDIEKRIEIIKFFDDFGANATGRAFGTSRSTIYLWKQKLKKAGGKLSALAPGDRKPKNKRHRVVSPFIERFVIDYRTSHPGADKNTITPALTTACKQAGIKPVSESTVGRIIHDLKERRKLPKSNKITINGLSGNLLVREPRHKRKKLRRKNFEPKVPGDLVQMDTVAIFTAGLKRYIFTALDVSTRFAFAYAYKSNSSANGNDFLGKFLKVAPFVTSRVQTDNGSEFAKHFEQGCQEKRLVHFYNYPRHPESNGFLERFNRTIQEQCVNLYLDYLDEPEDFNCKLMDYLIWYNTEKPHRGIGNLAPMRYYLNNFIPPKKSKMLWTLTNDCVITTPSL
jgi:putative transposase